MDVSYRLTLYDTEGDKERISFCSSKGLMMPDIRQNFQQEQMLRSEIMAAQKV
jgi:hypothetical protein